MKNRSLMLIWLAATICLAGCKNDDSEDPAPENLPPLSFVVTPAIDGSIVNLSWTESTDPEGGSVTYEVRLGAETLVEGLTETTFQLNDLSYEHTYEGKIIAKDSVGASVETDFSFVTGFLFLKSYEMSGIEYFLEYNEDKELVNIENSGSETNQVVRNANGSVIKMGASVYTYSSAGLNNTINDGKGEGIIQYDSKDRIIKMSSTYNFTPTYSVRVVRDHLYNDKDQLIQLDELIYDYYYEFYSYTRIVLQYDSRGNVIQTTTSSSSDGETYGSPYTTTYTYDDKKNPWYTILSEQTNLGPLHIEGSNLINNTMTLGNSVVYRTCWMSKNNLLSSRTESGINFYQQEYTYTYNDEGYPLTMEAEVTSSDRDPYTYYQRWYY